jgi:Tol biopolymer transport system component
MSLPLLLTALLVTAPIPGGPNQKLNGPLARGVVGEISFPPLTSPDGSYYVYSVDRDGDRVYELDSVRADGKYAPVRLLGSVPEYMPISTDGKSVVFARSDDIGGELGIVPIDGSAPPTTLVPSSRVLSFQQTSDGARVVYTSHPEPSEVVELFSVPSAGGAPVRLNGPLVAGGNVGTVVLSNDGSQVVYAADQDTDERVELFVAPVDGRSPARKLPIPLVLGGSVVLFQLDPDGSHVLYEADQDEDERFELFSIASDGSEPPRKLNGPLVPGGDVGFPVFSCEVLPCTPILDPGFELSFDGRWIVYGANQDTVERFELYAVPADGSRAAVKLSAPSNRDVFLTTLSYDSAWAIYQNDSRSPDELFSVPIDGSAPARRISGSASGHIGAFPQVSLDSRTVVYQADLGLYAAPVDGSTPPLQLNAPAGDDLVDTRFFPGFWAIGNGVAYQAEHEESGIQELHFVPVAGGVAPRELDPGPIRSFYPSLSYVQRPPRSFDAILFLRGGKLMSIGTDAAARPVVLDELPSGDVVGYIAAFDLAPAGDRVVYQAQEQDDLVAELYSVPTGKPEERVQVRPGPQLRPLLPPRLTPDGSRMLFLGSRQPLGFGDLDLYSAPADGSAAPLALDAPLAPPASVNRYFVAPDGLRVVFAASAGGHYSLFSVPVDGSRAPARLHEFAHGLGDPKISADSRWVVFEEESLLYAGPIDGSASARLVTSMPARSDFQLAGDGSRIVYRSGNGNGRNELFVVSTDGSAPPRKLSAPLQSRGQITGFALAPDSTRAVYRADQTADETFELYSVPVDGSAPPVRLSGSLIAGGDVQADFRISSDSQRVVYRADARVDEELELFSVPIDASRPPARLDPSLVAGGDVLDYQITPDGQRVVYRANQEASDVIALYSAPIRGGRGTVRLSRALVPGGDVRTFQISADSSTVAFTAERDAARELTLLAAPIAGIVKARELAGPFTGAGSVASFALSADGSVAAYTADQETPGVVELFAASNRNRPTVVKH